MMILGCSSGFRMIPRPSLSLMRRSVFLRSASSATSDSSSFTKLPRLLDESPLRISDPVPVTDEEVLHYLISVMRMREGSLLRVFNQRDGEFVARVATGAVAGVESSKRLRKAGLQLIPLSLFRPIDTKPKNARIAMFIPIIKKERMKMMVEKLTELGVDYLVPVNSKNTNDNFSKDDNFWKSLQKLVVQATEQSERLELPVLSSPIDLSELTSCSESRSIKLSLKLRTNEVSQINVHKLFICKERQSDINSITQAMNNFRFSNSNSNQENCVGIVIGPEGGLTKEESLKIERGAECISLGTNVLRSETAAIAAMSCASAMLNA